MSKRKHDSQLEKLSAFLDGELSEQEQNALVDQLSRDSALRDQLSRYQSIGAQLQQEEPSRVDASSVAEAVSAAIEGEPTILAPPRRKSSGVQRMALGAALAATVAAVAVSVAPQLLEPAGDVLPPETFAFSPRLSVPNVDATTVSLGGSMVQEQSVPSNEQQRWKTLQPEVQEKLDAYLLEHSEFAGRLGVAQPNVHVGFISNQNAQK